MADKKTNPAKDSGSGFSPETDKLVKNSVKLVSERFLPGASLLIDGKIVEGGMHAAVGLAARAVFGVPGMVALAANSYAKSVTGKNLLEHFQEIAAGESDGGDDDNKEQPAV